MPLAGLYNVPLDDEQKASWDFAHADHHRRMIAAAKAKFGSVLAEYVLDPFNVLNPDSALQHQQMHNAIDSLYGVSGYDLADVNWQNQEQRASWVWLNAQLHIAEAAKTGVY